MHPSLCCRRGWQCLSTERVLPAPLAVFAALFAAVSVYNRLDLTITKDSRWAEGQARDRAVGLLQQVAEVWEGACLTVIIDCWTACVQAVMMRL